MTAGPLIRFRRLRAGQRRLLTQHQSCSGVASAAVALLPFRFAIRFGCGAALFPARSRVRASRHLVGGQGCGAAAAVAHDVHRERGRRSAHAPFERRWKRSFTTAPLGTTRCSGRLEAHVWVSVGGACCNRRRKRRAFVRSRPSHDGWRRTTAGLSRLCGFRTSHP